MGSITRVVGNQLLLEVNPLFTMEPSSVAETDVAIGCRVSEINEALAPELMVCVIIEEDAREW